MELLISLFISKRKSRPPTTFSFERDVAGYPGSTASGYVIFLPAHSYPTDV